MKRILIINDHLIPEGGADKVAIEHYNIFKGVDECLVDFISADDELIGRYKPEVKNLFKNIFNVKAFKKVRYKIKVFSPDVVFVHSWTKQLSSSIFLACNGLDVRIIMHDYFLVCPNGGLYNYKRNKQCGLKGGGIDCLFENCDKKSMSQKIYRFLRFKIQNIIIRKTCKKVYYLNEFQAHLIENNIEIISPYKNNIPLFKPIQGENDSYAYIGRPDPEKGVNIFSNTNFHTSRKMLMIGLDSLKVNNNVDFKFFGWLDEKSMNKVLSNVKAVIFPSVWYEVDPLIPWEVMSKGIPVISFKDNIFGKYLSQKIPELVYSDASDLTKILLKLEDSIFYSECRTSVVKIFELERRKRNEINNFFFKKILYT